MSDAETGRPSQPDRGDNAAPANGSQALIAERRLQLAATSTAAAVRPPKDGSQVWGLALSGGGIRSATFSFGLLKGLAQQKLLNRFDVLSTVSGGGYIGGMLGRLYDRERPDAQQIAKSPAGNPAASTPQAATTPAPDRVQAAMANAQSTWFGWWLRSNGRYLAPAGFADRLFAMAIYLRNLIALHFEFGLIAVLVGCALAAMDLAVWQGIAAIGFGPETAYLFEWLVHLKTWLPTAWLLLAVAAVFALHWIMSYWDTQWVNRGFIRLLAGKAVLAGVLLMAAFKIADLPAQSTPLPGTDNEISLIPIAAAFAVVLLFTSALDAWFTWCHFVLKNATLVERGEPEIDAVTELRNQMSLRLAWCLRIGLAVLVLGVAERLAWLLAFEAQIFDTMDLGLLLAVVAGVAQALLSHLRASGNREQQRDAPSSAMWSHVPQLAGYLLTAALLVWWISLVLKLAVGPVFSEASTLGAEQSQFSTPDFHAGWLTLLYLVGPPALYVLGTGFNLGFLNISSLHNFYKARLVRTYLGATNSARFSGRGSHSALESIAANELTTHHIRNVGDVSPGDDLPLGKYAPHTAGGPVHIINTCVNQTADPKGRLFNRDRKGLILSVRAGGDSRLSQEGWRSEFKGIGKLSVGSWLSISGAAAAPGLGSRTQQGLAALMTFAGVRLGYWLSSAERQGPADPCAATRRWSLGAMTTKSRALVRELTASFGAGPRDDWYISDGGHFENTAVYPLLLERASVIVLADCGADPRYTFEDVENLVRKARIDMDVKITFRRPRATGSLKSNLPADVERCWEHSHQHFGTLQDLATDDTNACLALATVDYPGNTGSQAFLILVKPNTYSSASMDVANYKRQNPAFPQESTADQFFSESQWESYFSLGADLGNQLTSDLLAALQAHVADLFDLVSTNEAFEPTLHAAATSESGAASSPSQQSPAVLPAASRSVWGRPVGAVGATIGAGAAASLAVAAWQAFDTHRSAQEARVAGERSAMVEISKLWQALPAGTESAGSAQPAGQLAVALLRAGNSYCESGRAGWLRNSDLGSRIISDALSACSALEKHMDPACQTLVESRSGLSSMATVSCLVEAVPRSPAVYWGYDYSEHGSWRTMHPCSTQRKVLVEKHRQLQQQHALSETKALSDSDLKEVRKDCAAGAGGIAAPPPPSAGQLPPETAVPPASMAVPSRQPGSVSASPTSAGPSPRDTSTVCKDSKIYMQVYGSQMRDQVSQFRPWWHDKWGASVPPIEDVVATASRTARPAPREVERTTVRYHDASGLGCAEAIVQAVNTADASANWHIEPLSPAFKASKGVIEVWFTRNDTVSSLVQQMTR